MSLALPLAPAAVRHSSRHTSPASATDAVLPLLVSDGRAPTAALLSPDTDADGIRFRYSAAGPLASLAPTQATRGAAPLTPLHAVRIALTLPPARPGRCSCSTTGHNGRTSGSYVRCAATADGRRVLTFRMNTDAIADPRLEPAPLSAEFCPRIWWNGRDSSGDPENGHSFE